LVAANQEELMPRRFLRTVCSLVAIALVFGGCAGIVNPHITLDATVGKDGTPATLNQAIVYADHAKAEYRKALGNQAQLASWLGIGLIPLMSAAAGLGITGGPPAAITATTLTGVAAYGVGTWLYSKPYQRAWVAGYNATSCAITAVLPLRDVLQRKAIIEGHVNDVDLKREDVAGKAAALTTAIQNAPGIQNSPLGLRAKQRVQDAEAQLASTATTRTNVLKMLGQAEAAGPLLKEAVDRIAGQVSAQLVEVGPDLQALASIVGGLAQTYQRFASVPEALKPPARVTAQGASPQESAVLAALDDLDSAMRNLSLAHQRLADDIDRLGGTTPIETLRACGVSAEQVTIALALVPPGAISFDVGTAGTEGRVVTGGAAPFAIVPQGTLTDLSVRQTEPFGSSFVVQTTDKTPAGKITIFVTDRSGNKLFVPVTVNPATPRGPGPGTSPPDTSGTTPAIAALKKLKDDLDATPIVTLADKKRVVVSKPTVDEQAPSLAVDVTLEGQDGKALTKPQAAAVSNAVIRQAIARRTGGNVSPDKIVVRSKQGETQ
jgi:hypothetical protein